MNKRLEFRVWDIDAKRMIFPDKGYQGHYILTLSGKFLNLQNGVGGNEVEVMQYTGLKDRNGVKVYEGDILQENITEEMAAVGSSANVGEVYFAVGTFFIDGDGPIYNHVYSNSPEILEDYKVIGNVFETPELL